MSTDYADAYRNIDFREHSEKYVVGRGEQGVLIAEPYKSEILPFWKFATPAVAETSATKICELFINYKKVNDFVGMDMAPKIAKRLNLHVFSTNITFWLKTTRHTWSSRNHILKSKLL